VRANGFQQVEEQPISIETAFTFDDYWPFLGGRLAGIRGVASDSVRMALESKLRGRLLGERQEGGFALRARAWAVKGAVPAH
jgi:hypothetical protein